MKKLEYFKVVLILPGNVLITIPLIIFFLTKGTYSYNLINLNSVLFFYISLLFLIVGLWLAIWSVRTFYNHGGDGTPGPWKPVSKLIIAKTTNTEDHGIMLKRIAAKGGPTTWPAEPAAVVIPSARDLFSGDAVRPTTASIGPNPLPAIPKPIKTFRN